MRRNLRRITAVLIRKLFTQARKERQDVFAALTQSDVHAAFTGTASQIDPTPGGAFTQHDGQIIGRTLEVTENAALVQAWRVTAWPAGVYSLVNYRFEATDGGCRLVLDHTGLPEGSAELITQGWEGRYWAPMQAFFAG